MTKDEMIAACLETRKQGYDQAADRFQAEIDALTAQLAAALDLLARLTEDDLTSVPPYQSGTTWDDYGAGPECVYCTGTDERSGTTGCLIVIHQHDCPILLGQQLLASKEVQHEC